MSLTDPAAKNAKSKEKPFKLTDAKGMYLEVMPNGSKYWRLKYRYLGKEKRLALGVYPDVSLKQARDKRDEARKQIAAGNDPGQLKQVAKRAKRVATANSFEAVTREWLENIRAKWTPDHYDYTLRRFEAYVFPEIGSLPITEVDAPALLAMARKIEAQGTIETAHKVTRACGQVFRYAIASLPDGNVKVWYQVAQSAQSKIADIEAGAVNAEKTVGKEVASLFREKIPRYRNYSHTMHRTIFDCRQQKYFGEETIDYSADGAVLDRLDAKALFAEIGLVGSNRFSEVFPGSYIEMLMTRVCK